MYYKATGIIGEGWYDLNEKDIKCPQCGDLLTNSQVYNGTTCCCRTCTNKYRYASNPEFREKFKKSMKDFNDKNWANPEYREKQSKRLAEESKLNATDPIRKENHRNSMRIEMEKRNSDFEYQARCKRGGYLAKHSDNEVTYVYYAEIPNNDEVYKIGITKNIEQRQYAFMDLTDEYYVSIEELANGSVEDMAELEYQIKMNFCIRDSDNGNEFIPRDQLLNVINFVSNFKVNG